MAFLQSAHGLIHRVSTALAWLPPAVARLAVGITFAEAGWGKLTHIDRPIGFFTQLGIPAPVFHAWLVSGLELGCGVLLLIGLATRLAAIPLIGIMAVALATALREEYTGDNSVTAIFGLAETLLAILCLWLAIAGPGALSVDRLLARRLACGEKPAAPVA